ncbi:MAG TPA: DpnI domain-containing protein [Candidatus Sulfotelmatobacter sp.]|nr:DpnI domain-containing protein [Candidatus Sulfotelmatobacter sp.]
MASRKFANATPSYYFMHYDLRTWTVRNLLLVPHFAFPPSAIVKRKPLSAAARRAGWVGCNFALDRVAADARIQIVYACGNHVSPNNKSSEISQSLLTFAATDIRITPPEEVREKFRRIKPLKELSITQRGWTLDVLNIVRRISDRRRRMAAAVPTAESLTKKSARMAERQLCPTGDTFANADVYAYERDLAQLHPDNRHIKDKIRQQLQVLRDLGILSQTERGVWKIEDGR